MPTSLFVGSKEPLFVSAQACQLHFLWGAKSLSSFCLCVRVVSCLTPTLFLRSIPREGCFWRRPFPFCWPPSPGLPSFFATTSSVSVPGPYRLTVRIPGFHPGARDSIPREGGPQANHTFCVRFPVRERAGACQLHFLWGAKSLSSFCLCVRVVSCLAPTLFLRSIPREGCFWRRPFPFCWPPSPGLPSFFATTSSVSVPYRLTVRIPGFHPGARDSIPREGGPQANHTFCGEQRASPLFVCVCVWSVA